MSVYIDLSEFLSSLRKTGIERICGEICKYAPPGSLIPVRFHGDRYLSLPPALIESIGRYFQNAGEAVIEEMQRLSAPENGSVVKLSGNDTMLVPEIFAGPRAEFFLRRTEQELERYRFIVYDLLPATHPEFFLPDMPVALAEYFRVVARSGRCGFISDFTCDAYHRRLKRTNARGGVVLPLGSDAFGARADKPIFNRQLTFSVLGTIEPRKNHKLILEAFEPLLRQIEGLSLWFVGKMGWDEALAQRVHTLSSDPNSGFRFFPSPSDGEIGTYISQCRATIYVSAAEGYGLPPVESLWIGTPVIASTTIPSLERLGSAGIHYVDPLTVIGLRSAILDFLDDDYANRKVEETLQTNLPTWRSFAEEVLRWCRMTPV